MSTALTIAQFRWRLFSIAQRVIPNLFDDKMNRCALELQIEPEDMYSNIPSPSVHVDLFLDYLFTLPLVDPLDAVLPDNLAT